MWAHTLIPTSPNMENTWLITAVMRKSHNSNFGEFSPSFTLIQILHYSLCAELCDTRAYEASLRLIVFSFILHNFPNTLSSPVGESASFSSTPKHLTFSTVCSDSQKERMMKLSTITLSLNSHINIECLLNTSWFCYMISYMITWYLTSMFFW